MSESGPESHRFVGRQTSVGPSAALFERASRPIAAVRGTDDPQIAVVNEAYDDRFAGPCRDDPDRLADERRLTAIERELVRATVDGGDDHDTVQRSTPRGRRSFAVRAIPSDRTDLSAFLLYREITAERIRDQQLAVLRRVLRHDLRNDLTVLLGYAETIAETTDDPETHEQAAAMVAAATDLRSVATSAGRMQCVTGPAESSAIGDAIAKARRAVADDLADGFRIEGAVPSTSVDRRVAIALEELCTTLVAHGDPATIRCSADVEDEWATLRLDADTRIGDQELAALEGRNETKLRHATGISPWIVRWAVRAAGGRITVDEYDGGCTFRLESPVLAPSQTAREPPQQPGRRPDPHLDD